VIDVRTISEDEVPAYAAAVATGFHQHPAEGESEYRRGQLDLHRTYGAFEGTHMIGTARSFPTELTVPGGATLAVAAVTNVTVTGTHRRRGVMTSMMRAQLDEVAGRGEPGAILIASEAPIYGRFGYGPATEHLLVEVDLSVGTIDGPAPGGSSRLSTAEEMRKVAPAVYERFRTSQPGAIGRDERWWDVRFGIVPVPGRPARPDEFFAVHCDDAGEADGYVRYSVRPDWDYRVPRSIVEIGELVAASDDAYAGLWRHCTGLDLVRRISAENRPPLEPLPWMMTDRRAVRQRDRADLVWLRLLDVPAALSTRRYRVEDRLVLEVEDGFRPDAELRLVLDGGPEGATCDPTDAAPDLTLGVADLGAAYLGGTPLWPAAQAGLVTEHRDGAVAAFDRLFLTDRPPWCNTWF
jgi:predicted acetyltransferase